MTQPESYVTKANPSMEDWLEYNKDWFAVLNGMAPEAPPQYAPFVDVDQYAAKAGVSTKEYYEQVKEKVGPLGRAALQLVHSDMDDAWHIIIHMED